jgi:hypothetical protein
MLPAQRWASADKSPSYHYMVTKMGIAGRQGSKLLGAHLLKFVAAGVAEFAQ